MILRGDGTSNAQMSREEVRAAACKAMSQAEDGKRSELFKQTLEECERTASITQPEREDPEEEVKRYKRVIELWYAGDMRAATRMLKVGGICPPGSENTIKVRTKFRTEEADITLAKEPDLIRSAMRCKPGRITPADVQTVIEDMSANRCPAASGWRNAHIKAFANTVQGNGLLTR